MSEAPSPGGEPPNLKTLRRLVTVLAGTMIAGFVVLIGLFVIRLTGERAVPLPGEIALPGGARAVSVTVGPEWYLVVTERERLLVFDRDTGALRREVRIGAD